MSSAASVAVETSASQSSYDVAATIKLINHTKWPLKLENCHPNYGHIETVINLVQPGQQDIMRMHKKGFTTSGTSGTVAWRVEGMRVSVIVMWSLPYNLTFRSNVLAVGLCDNGRNWAAIFDEMFYKEETYFKRKEFYNTDIVITGIMGTTSKADIVINIEPTNALNRFVSPLVKTQLKDEKHLPEGVQHQHSGPQQSSGAFDKAAFQTAVQKEVERQLHQQQHQSPGSQARPTRVYTRGAGRRPSGRGYNRGGSGRNDSRRDWTAKHPASFECSFCGRVGHMETECDYICS
ncbi:tereporin-Ca1-like isoform X2 [Paramacrobiotus metropolitanus]|uniref:tereporin-Ca1-like isoform X2 n=1 Tax=Paramacrobiotus metropolitanus TaxID=2943436 RepID=UPI002446039F|nr:tereporin-Ca1-like isoform X2 [Paramacrobiotus metropolitanus]